MKLDESIDISDNDNLMCFVNHDLENTIHEKSLFCKPLIARTPAVEYLIWSILISMCQKRG